MRIVYILTSLGIGGAEKQVIALAERMAARGHVVRVLVLKDAQSNQWPTNLPVHYVGMRKSVLSIARALWRARRIMCEFKPDLLHSHTFPANITARFLRLLNAVPANLSTIHNVYEGGSSRMALYRLTDPLSLHTTAVSAAAAKRFVQLHAVPGRKCSVIPNAIDLGEFTPDRARRAFLRSQICGSGSFTWLAVGRIVPAKDYANLLTAFSLLHREEPSASLWIAGEFAHPEEKVKLHSLLEECDIGDHVQFLGLRGEIAGLLDAADGFVLSSAWEGMPLALGEAMAMQKPVVATDVGGVREILGDCGAIVHAGDAAALAKAMLRVMHAPAEECHALGLAARHRIASYFSMDTRIGDWEGLYEKLLSHEPAPQHILPYPG